MRDFWFSANLMIDTQLAGVKAFQQKQTSVKEELVDRRRFSSPCEGRVK